PALSVASLVRDAADGALVASVDGQVRRSDDGGLTWPSVGDVLCDDLAIAPPRAGVWIAGCIGKVFVDGAAAPAPAAEKGLPMFEAALLRSDDQGSTWTVAQGGLTGLFSGSWRFLETTAPLEPGPIYAALLNPFGSAILRSDDGGLTWPPTTSPTREVRSLIEDAENGRLIAGSFGNGVYVSTDDGLSWRPQNEGLLSGRVDRLALDPKDPGRLWAAGGGAHRYDGPVQASRCRSTDRILCLLDRFQVEVTWTDFEDRTGHGRPWSMTPNTGGFWFFGPDNLEFTLKILDGRSFNDHFWLFYGGLSTVSYTLTATDLETGVVRTVQNTSGELIGGADTLAFPAPSGDAEVTAGHGVLSPAPEKSPLRLQEDRFEVEVFWVTEDGNSGLATGAKLSPDTATFSFFDPDNLEIFVKVLDGRSFNDHFWLFFTGLSNVYYDVVVTDTVTGEQRIYSNPQGSFGGLADTQLFAAP
ncbi:MAG: sialidase family protein, partial [Acidobacteriota bacterium]